MVLSLYEKISEEIKQNYYQQNFKNDGERFVAWYLRNVHLRDPNQTKYDMTDGQDDKQIDSIVVEDDTSTVYIVQGKFIGTSNVDSQPLREVLSSWLHLKDLVKLQETANEKLKRRLVDLSAALDDEYEVIFELVTTAALTGPANNDLRAFQEQLAKDEDLAASINVIDNDELKRRYELALERELPSINYSIPLEKENFLSTTIAGTSVVLAAIPLKDCIKIPGIRDGSLFRKNVRQFMGLSNKVNKSIKSTIYSDKHKDFFFYHNGITAICDKMAWNNGTLTLRGLSIVNGCQSLRKSVV